MKSSLSQVFLIAARAILAYPCPIKDMESAEKLIDLFIEKGGDVPWIPFRVIASSQEEAILWREALEDLKAQIKD